MPWLRRVLVPLLLAAGAAVAADTPFVFLYECRPASTTPVVDGRLEDPGWQDLPRLEGFFQYWKPAPLPPALRTVGKLCYDDQALYLGVTLYEEQLDKIAATITGRDMADTWKDDCVEVMLDPANNAQGFVKLTTNFRAARYDERDGAAGWNGENWTVATSRTADAWTIELRLPWSDLGAKPAPGELWSFNLVRYGWSTGEFRGVTWALGASYATPANFGYLHFGRLDPADTAALQRLAPIIGQTKGRTFQFATPDSLFIHEAGRWTRQPLDQWAEALGGAARTSLDTARQAMAQAPGGVIRTRLEGTAAKLAGRLEDFRKRCRPEGGLTPGATPLLREEARQLKQEADDLRWEALLLELLGNP